MSDIRSRIMQFTTQPVLVQVADLGDIHIRRMTLAEMDKMQNDAKLGVAVDKKPIPMATRLLAQFIGDEQGKAVFDVSKPEDVDIIQSLPVHSVAEILRHGNKINRTDMEGKD